jgi:nucleotide-binding universal stress UspA family protein
MSPAGVKRVLVPVDFSDRCVEVVRWALNLAGGGEVTVVHVVPPLAPADPAVLWGHVDDVRRLEAVRHTLTRWLEDHQVEGVSVQAVVGAAGPSIVAVAAELDVELIAMPSHRRADPGLFSLGTVAERVVRTAPCAVWVAR